MQVYLKNLTKPLLSVIFFKKGKIMEPEKISGIISEMNVVKELQKEKKKREKQLIVVREESSKIPTSMQAMELSLVFNTSLDERKQGWCKRYLKSDYYVEARAVIPEPESEPDLIREEDLNTLLVCFLLLKHSRIKPSKYTFETTPYQITKFFGEDIGGRQYADLKESLSRLQANRISTNFWWDTVNGERAIKNDFHFLNSVREGEEKSLRISLSEDIVESLEHGYVKLLTESSLRGILKIRGHAKVLALFLLKLLGYKSHQDLNLKTVLRYLGVENKYNKLPGYRFRFYISKMITPAVEKAAKVIGFTCAYNKNKQQFHLRRITKIEQIESHEEELSGGTEAEGIEQGRGKEENSHDPLLTQRKNEAFRRLTDIGVASEMITKIFNEFNIEEIERQIEWLPYRKSDDPPAVFVSAIHNHWEMPAEYEQKREETLKLRES